MRRACLFSLLAVLTGICAAQDTNFPAGPQYLITNGSPLFLHSIATPTLSFTAPAASAPETTAEVAAEEQAVYTPPRIPNTTNFSRIYWGEPSASENAGGQMSEIEMSSEQISTLPASIFNAGVTEMIGARALPDREYGTTLAEAAAFWRTHKSSVSHVYTNADIARLHGG